MRQSSKRKEEKDYTVVVKSSDTPLSEEFRLKTVYEAIEMVLIQNGVLPPPTDPWRKRKDDPDKKE